MTTSSRDYHLLVNARHYSHRTLLATLSEPNDLGKITPNHVPDILPPQHAIPTPQVHFVPQPHVQHPPLALLQQVPLPHAVLAPPVPSVPQPHIQYPPPVPSQQVPLQHAVLSPPIPLMPQPLVPHLPPITPPALVAPSTNTCFQQVCDMVQIQPPQILQDDKVVPWNTLDSNLLAPAYAQGPLSTSFQIPSFSRYIGFSDSEVHLR